MADEKNTVSDLADLKDIAGGAPATEAPAEGEAPAAPVVRTGPAAVLREKEVDAQGRAYATGRRKDAVARVWLKPGTGKIIVNGREQEVYFARPTLRLVINQPFQIADREGRRLPHPRPARGRAQEVRPRQGPPQLPVLEALSGHGTARTREGRLREGPPFFYASCAAPRCASSMAPTMQPANRRPSTPPVTARLTGPKPLSPNRLPI